MTSVETELNLSSWCYLSINRKKGVASKDIHADMAAVLEDDAPVLAAVQKWVTELRRFNESLEDDRRSGRPATVTTE